jgi:hypothetical protein
VREVRKVRGIGNRVAILIVLIGAGGCASNPAQSSAAVPLQIPEPPPRGIMAPIAEPEAAPPPDRPAPPPIAASPPASTPVAPPRAATPPAVAPSPEPPKPAPAPDLRPAAAGQVPSAADVVASIARVKQKLDAITPTRLNAGKRADYDSARRFVAQAETAVKENNLMLAQSSTAKAETLADGLR